MTDKYITQLKIVAINALTFTPKMIQYKVCITSPGKKSFNAVGPFTSEGFSRVYEVEDPNAEIIFTLMNRGHEIQKIRAKAFKESERMYSKFTMKWTIAQTEKTPNHVKEIYLDKSEVAWYLVKKPELMGELMDRIYVSPPSEEDWEIIRANNQHLGGPNRLMSLLPGQVVVLATHKKETPKVLRYRQQAKQAQQQLDEMLKEPLFDRQFFAEHYDLFYDVFTQAKYVGVTSKPVPNIIKPEKPSTGLDYGAIAKGSIDGSLGFIKSGNEQVLKAFEKIVKAMDAEKKAGSALANPKNFKLFRQKYAGLYEALDNAYGKTLFKWDTGIQTGNMRRVIKNTAFVRGSSYKGGLSAYLEHMKEGGKLTKKLKMGGNLLLAYDAYDGGSKIYEGYRSGDMDKLHHAVAVEPLKLAGSFGGAEAGAYLGMLGGGVLVGVIGVSTGGVGLVVIGICGAAGGLAGGAIGGIAGEFGGEAWYDFTK